MKKTGGIKETPVPEDIDQDKKQKKPERRMTMSELKVDI